MSAKKYRGYSIIEFAKASLPPTARYKPYIRHTIVLTERYLFILEDEDNDNYIERYAIPLHRVNEFCIEKMAKGNRKKQLLSIISVAISGIFGALSGHMAVYGEVFDNALPQTRHILITYIDEEGVSKQLRFAEIDRDIRKLIKFRNKHLLH